MLRRTIAILLLTIIGCSFYFWSHVKSETVNDLNELIDRLSAEIYSKDMEAAKATAEEIKEIQENKQELFNYVHDHEFMNDMADYISEIEIALKNSDMSRLETAVEYLRSHINDFYNDSKLRLSNII